MPSRSNIFVTNYYYHIYNKTLDQLQPFKEKVTSDYFLNLINYYKYSNLKMSYSATLRLESDQRLQYLKHLEKSKKYKIEILSYCLMPNHFHLLLKQKEKVGISKYMGDFLNGFTRYFNILYKRKGPIFLPRFRSKPIMNEEHLIHVSRYIHLNPYISGLIDTIKDVWTYPLSSAAEYYSNKVGIINSNHILGTGYFLENREKYRKFVESEAEYGKTRALIKYIEKWNS